MKKILFVVVTFLVGLDVVYALDDAFAIKNQYKICEGSNSYPIYSIWVNSRYAFFLNLSNNYNLNFEDYYPVSFEDTQYPEDIKYYNSAYIYDYISNNHYIRSIHRVLWERLYPEKTFNMCDSVNEREIIYQDIKKKIYDIKKGPTFIFDKKVQIPNTVYEYEDENLNQFYVYDSAGLDVTIQNNKMIVSGEVGTYKVILKRIVAVKQTIPSLYTDGTNYLLFYNDVTDEEYVFNIEVSYPKYELIIKDENQNILNNACFNIDNIKYCSDILGKINFSSATSSIEITYINDLNEYENYSCLINLNETKEITLIKKKKEIIVLPEEDMGREEEISPPLELPDQKDDVITPPLEDNSNDKTVNKEEIIEDKYIEIEVEDTFVFSYSFLILGILCAFIFRK